jgi:hypothetical protein
MCSSVMWLITYELTEVRWARNAFAVLTFVGVFLTIALHAKG